MKRILAAGLIAAALSMAWSVAVVSADTCCGSSEVGLDPPQGEPGDTVTLEGLACKAADGSGSSPLALLGGFHLDADSPEGSLGDAPDAAEWPAFSTVADPDALAGSASIVIPEVPDGRYRLWWACHDPGDPDGASFALQYSTGPRLVVGSPPDTSTAGSSGPTVIERGRLILSAAGLLGLLLGMLGTRARRAGTVDVPRSKV